MQQTTLKLAPYDVGAMDLKRPPDEDFAWPCAFSTIVPELRQQIRRYSDFAAKLDDSIERAVVLGAFAVLNPIQGLLEAALYLDSEKAAGIRLDGSNWQLEYLRSGRIDDQSSPPLCANLLSFPARSSFNLLRNIKVTASMNGLGFPASLVNPTATALSINPLISSAILQPGNRVRFAYATSFLDQSQAAPAKSPYSIDGKGLARRLASYLMEGWNLGDATRERLYFLVEKECRHALSTVSEDLGQLSTISKLPDVLWSGTGGHYIYRLLGVEQIRRGNLIRRFAHGAMPTLLMERSELAQLNEFAVSSEFVFSSSRFLDVIRQIGTLDNVPENLSCTFNYSEAGHKRTNSPVKEKTPRTRRRVLYAPTLPRGFGRYGMPDLRETVYIDWRMKLINQLNKMPIDLVVKFHPAETRSGFSHYLPEGVETTLAPFEEILDDVDVVVFDYFKSSTIPTTLSTDKPVVLIDIDNSDFRPTIRFELDKRCRLITGEYDSNNLPCVDQDVLEEAVCSGQGSADPEFFQSIYQC
jgi:hypothetical protein